MIYLTDLQVPEAVYRQMVRWLLDNELERTWKKSIRGIIWGNIREHIPVEANACNNRRAMFCVVRVARVATKRCGKHISASVNQYATIEEAVFSVGVPRGYITRISRS
jgi:hypothetical protein